MEWTRVQLGIPVRPITIDVQSSTRIVQVRVEPTYILLNLVPVTVLVLLLLSGRWLWQRRKALRS